jgi:hypothetical protein
LIENSDLRHRLGNNLQRKVEREYSTDVVIRQWEAALLSGFIKVG